MKLKSVEQARAIWFYQAADVNPTGKFWIPMLPDLVTRYKFSDLPNVTEAIKNKTGLIFGQGAFNHPTLGEINLDIALYNDAIFADTRTSTDASEHFLDDFHKWMESAGFAPPAHIRKHFLSRIFVEMETELKYLNPKLEEFARLLTAKSKRADLGNINFGLSGLLFTTQQASGLVPPPFKFERADNVPFSQNRYFSLSGLRTSEHLELLEKLEELLG